MDSRLKCNTLFFIQKDFVWREIPQTLSGGIIDEFGQADKPVRREHGGVGFSRQETAHASDRVFDAAFLPRRMRIAKPCFHAVDIREMIVVAEFGAVVESD